MIYFRNSTISKEGVCIFTEEEMKEMGKKITVDNTICKGFFLGDLNLGQLAKAINLDERGAYDFAVPQKWAEDNYFPNAIWFYPREGENRLFGRPMYVSAMVYELKSIILERAMSVWNKHANEDALEEVSND